MSIKKELDALMMAIVRCEMKWGGVIHINSIDIGMSVKKELDALIVSVARCPMN